MISIMLYTWHVDGGLHRDWLLKTIAKLLLKSAKTQMVSMHSRMTPRECKSAVIQVRQVQKNKTCLPFEYSLLLVKSNDLLKISRASSWILSQSVVLIL